MMPLLWKAVISAADRFKLMQLSFSNAENWKDESCFCVIDVGMLLLPLVDFVCFFQTSRIQEVVPRTQTLFVTVASASSPTWCATTRPTVPMDLTSWTVVSGARESACWRLLSRRYSTWRCRSSVLEHIFGLPGSCAFNGDDQQWEETCQLAQNSDDDFDWRMSRRSALPLLGPYVDHSPGQFSHWSPTHSHL